MNVSIYFQRVLKVIMVLGTFAATAQVSPPQVTIDAKERTCELYWDTIQEWVSLTCEGRMVISNARGSQLLAYGDAMLAATGGRRGVRGLGQDRFGFSFLRGQMNSLGFAEHCMLNRYESFCTYTRAEGSR